MPEQIENPVFEEQAEQAEREAALEGNLRPEPAEPNESILDKFSQPG